MNRYTTKKKVDERYRVCIRCLEPKPTEEFRLKLDKMNKNPLKRHSYCTHCFREYQHEHHLKNKDVVQERKRNRILKNRLIMISHLKKHPCVDCRESDLLVLDFDHVRGSKVGDVGRMAMNGVCSKAMLEEINKCEVRCANCHRKKTAIDQNHWRVALCKQYEAEKSELGLEECCDSLSN